MGHQHDVLRIADACDPFVCMADQDIVTIHAHSLGVQLTNDAY